MRDRGGYLVWGWVREGKALSWALAGAGILALYGLVAALQPIAEFGRVYAAYGGIFIALALAWGVAVDGFRPDRYDLLGALICVVGVPVMVVPTRGVARVDRAAEEARVERVEEMRGERSRVLFLCTHNSARSQMIEGLLRHLAGDRFEAHSAGTEATHVRPLAIRAMDELGVDISHQESETLDRYLDQPFDYVVTVCDEANEACPLFPNARRRLHWSLPDPSKATGTEEDRLEVFRSVRDELRARIEGELIAVRG